MPHRLPDWPLRLEKFFEANRSRKFEYGRWDCCLFAAAAIQAITGEHPNPTFIGAYATKWQAKDLIKRETGHAGVQFIWRKVMKLRGFEEIAVGFAQRGDPVLVRRGSGHSLAVISLSGKLMVATQVGLASIDRSLAVSAWRI